MQSVSITEPEHKAAHRKFRDDSSDFLGYLKLWDFYREQAKHLSTSKMRKLCQTNFLSFVRMREWHDVHNQLKEVVGEMGLFRPSGNVGASPASDRDDLTVATIRSLPT